MLELSTYWMSWPDFKNVLKVSESWSDDWSCMSMNGKVGVVIFVHKIKDLSGNRFLLFLCSFLNQLDISLFDFTKVEKRLNL